MSTLGEKKMLETLNSSNPIGIMTNTDIARLISRITDDLAKEMAEQTNKYYRKGWNAAIKETRRIIKERFDV